MLWGGLAHFLMIINRINATPMFGPIYLNLTLLKRINVFIIN